MKVLRSSRELPHIIADLGRKAADVQRFFPFFLIIRHGVIQARIRGVFQHGGAYDLVFKILIDISRLAGQRADLLLFCIQTVDDDIAVHITDDKVRDQAV